MDFEKRVLLISPMREGNDNPLSKALSCVFKEPQWHKTDINDFLQSIYDQRKFNAPGYTTEKMLSFLMAILQRGSRAWQNQAAKFFIHLPAEDFVLEQMMTYLSHEDIYIQRIMVRSFGIIASRYKTAHQGHLPYEKFEPVRKAIKQWLREQNDNSFYDLGKRALKKLNDEISVEKQCYQRLLLNGFDLPRDVLEQTSALLKASQYAKKHNEGPYPYSTLTHLIDKWLRKKQPHDPQVPLVLLTFKDSIIFSQLLRNNHAFFNTMLKTTDRDIFDPQEQISQIAFYLYQGLKGKPTGMSWESD